MAEAPEITLNRALASFLDQHGLAEYRPGERLIERGVRVDGKMPAGSTAPKEFTLLTPLRPLPDGGADMIYRVQLYTAREGTLFTVRQWAADLRAALDEKTYTPPILGISRAWEFSGTDFGPDSNGIASTTSTYYFRGRRP